MPDQHQHLVSTDWLAANLGDPQVRLFDCSVDVTIEDGKLRYGSGTGLYAAQHIPGAAFADLTSGLNLHDEEHHWFTLPAPDAFASALPTWGFCLAAHVAPPAVRDFGEFAKLIAGSDAQGGPCDNVAGSLVPSVACGAGGVLATLGAGVEGELPPPAVLAPTVFYCPETGGGAPRHASQ